MKKMVHFVGRDHAEKTGLIFVFGEENVTGVRHMYTLYQAKQILAELPDAIKEYEGRNKFREAFIEYGKKMGFID